MEVDAAVQTVLVAFKAAKEAIETTFGVAGAPAVVGLVLKGFKPREGVCLNGLEYSVHGIGYTVVFPDEGQAHIDGSVDGDLFSVHDVSFFLESSGVDPVPDIEVLEVELEKLLRSGSLHKAGARKYLMP